jgi:hypothetical protein
MGDREINCCKVGLHQGSAPRPYLFVLIMDLVVQDIIKPTPWNLLFADDILIIVTQGRELRNN